MTDEQEQKVSKFSSGINILMRLNTLWIDTHSHSRLGKYIQWNADLDRIWLELARDLTETNYGTQLTKMKEINDKIKNIKNFNDSPPAGFEEVSKEIITNRDTIYELLMEKQLLLARLENFLGKGTTADDLDADDFD